MRIPHAENATVDIRKLRDYCLNLEHPEGKHKARLFAAALGMTEADVEPLRGHPAAGGQSPRRDTRAARCLRATLSHRFCIRLAWLADYLAQRLDHRARIGGSPSYYLLSPLKEAP
jgi:hypothetical protein